MKGIKNLSNIQYSEFIALSRYARWIPDVNRREDWKGTVTRYITFFKERFPQLPESLWAELYTAIYQMDVMPSMRSLMTAGEALTRDPTAGFNCFSGDTEFLTPTGYKSLIESVGDEVIVLTEEGIFRPARVESFGKQMLQGITFRPTRSGSKVRDYEEATKNHRWLTENRGEVTDLRVGDSVRFNRDASIKVSALSREGVIQGFGFGDGTLDTRGRARVRLCGKKAEYLSLFEDMGNCSIMSPPSYGDDPLIVYHKGYMEDWKKIPYHKVEDIAWIRGWFRGYLYADGHSDPAQPGISTCDIEAADFIERIAPLCGYMVTGRNVSSVMETNYGVRKAPLIRITLREEGVWYVTEIEELEEQEVFCVVEPVTKTFTLSTGMLTGNCSYLAIEGTGESIEVTSPEILKAVGEPITVTIRKPICFDEAMYILMCGSGVGFSVERQFISTLPTVGNNLSRSIYLPHKKNYPGVDKGEISTYSKEDNCVVVHDSKYGWASALRIMIVELYNGNFDVKWDTSLVRPKGAPLKVFGGRASGPAPLEELFQFIQEIFSKAKGRKLTSLECHDIVCKVGAVVVVGGVRRSACISLSNLTDSRMQGAKSGDWWMNNAQRALANNSVAYTEKPDIGIFMKEFLALYESKSGERGIFSRVASEVQVLKNGRRKGGYQWGTNPCSEIILRSQEFCNLSEVIVREKDGVPELLDKVRIATILGTLQSSLTEFKYLNPKWQENTEEERLLGVSLTGIMDNPILSGEGAEDDDLKYILQAMKEKSVETNKEYATLLDIPVSAAITCV